MRKHHCLLVLATAFFLALNAQAASLDKHAYPPRKTRTADIWSTLSSFYQEGDADFQVGPFWGLAGKEQHININGAIGDTYDTTDNSDVNVLLGLGFYTNPKDKGVYDLSYGLNLFYLGSTTYKGTITQERLFTNLTYEYDITHFPIYFVAKGSKPLKNDKYTVTGDVGIGPNIMFLSRVRESALPGGVIIPGNNFSGTTNVAFSVTVGAGVKIKNAFQSTPIECGYRFFYLGQGDFKRNTAQLLNDLNTGQTFGNAIMCSMHI